MASNADELTVNWEENGRQVVRELDKRILSKGAWATVIFRYSDWDGRRDDWGPEKFTIRRYQKRNGEYRQQSKFNISSRDQAQSIIEALQGWLKE
ncbi:MAG: hypothetical protein KDG50_07515 [Chromatiales bacterium]|nr:hypothetical protein [Chromatiales bacterium]